MAKRKHNRKPSSAKRRGPTPPRRNISATPAAPARHARRRKPDPVANTMFFPRLLRQARWMFALLALAFALGFVVFGVGSSVGGSGLSDLFQGRVAATGPSVDELEKRVADNPRDAEGWHNLSQAHLQDGDRVKAVEALERYLRLRPRDSEGLEELASLQLSEALKISTRIESIQASQPRFAPPAELLPSGPLAQVMSNSPFAEASQQSLQQRLAPLEQRYNAKLEDSLTTYQRLVTVAPENAGAQIQLAQVAEQAGQYETALASYRRYVALAPDDAIAGQVRERIKALDSFLKSQSAPVGSG